MMTSFINNKINIIKKEWDGGNDDNCNGEEEDDDDDDKDLDSVKEDGKDELIEIYIISFIIFSAIMLAAPVPVRL